MKNNFCILVMSVMSLKTYDSFIRMKVNKKNFDSFCLPQRTHCHYSND